MAVDKREKKKKKREEKQKARRQEAEKWARRERIDEYRWEADYAYRNKEYREALTWALKALKLFPGDKEMRTLAFRAAHQLDDYATVLTLAKQSYREGSLTTRQEYSVLGRLAYSQKDYKLAQEVLEILLADIDSGKSKLTGFFGKAKLREARDILLHCRLLNGASGKSEKASPPGRAASGLGARASSGKAQEEEDALRTHRAIPAPVGEAAVPEKLPDLNVTFDLDAEPVLEAIRTRKKCDRETLDLTLKAFKLSFRTSYDQLICLPTLRDVRSLWYQEETARKVMKTFRGRAVLADEVGLGKTIEAGLIIKEYMMRGLVRTALVLAPSSLVHQWREELTGKFGIPFVSTNDAAFKQDAGGFWNEPLILSSIQTARSKRHFDAVTSRSYDIVVVDEAHHLKNRTTLNWKLLNAIQKTFLLMLTATPVQNSLEELFNLITLLRPGHLKTQKAFKEQFVTRGNPTDPRNREKLRELLKEVMVRNTRSVTQLHLPPRFALTVRISPTREEETFYEGISRFVAGQVNDGASQVAKFTLKKLLEAAGSSHAAALRMLERMRQTTRGESGRQVDELVELGGRIRVSGKIRNVLELLRSSAEQKIVFVNHVATLEYLQQMLRESGLPHVVFSGAMNAAQKQAAIDSFRSGKQVFLATGTGGEGHNLQFCRTMLNFDLPWNPMEIEQRIGRIHRIGQEREVQVYNFCAAGTVEDRILDILDRKINMFELVVGEIDMILGRLQGEEEFSDLVYEIWVKHSGEEERGKAFDALASRLKRARSAYDKSKELDEKLFQEDFGI